MGERVYGGAQRPKARMLALIVIVPSLAGEEGRGALIFIVNEAWLGRARTSCSSRASQLQATVNSRCLCFEFVLKKPSSFNHAWDIGLVL